MKAAASLAAALRRYGRTHRVAAFSAVLLLAIIGLAIAAPWVAPYDYAEQDIANRLEPPDAEHWFGTDNYGRDILSRIIWGARISLMVGVGSTLLGLLVGGTLGILGGYRGGWVDLTVTRIIEVLLAFPSFVLCLLVVGLLGPGVPNLISAIAVSLVPKFARAARTGAMGVANKEFVEAAKTLGAGNVRIMACHIAPNVIGDLAVLALRTVHDFPQLYKHYAQRDFTFNGKTQPNRNLELKTVAGVDGLKTGHTEEGGFGQTTSAIRDGRRLILVLNGMSTIAERAQETARLIEWGFRESSNKTILKGGDTVAEAPVWLGEKEKVPLVIPQSVMVTSMVGQTAQPRIVARFDGPVAAPIAKGAKLGTAVVTMPDNRTIEYPLLAGEAVERAGVVSRVSTLIRHYLLGWAS
ncbi:MAG: ABC transporter permease subunit [Proteobacteria bacterium]|nr:ABC transporter permease subunit [Pseudomonadota bacterium]